MRILNTRGGTSFYQWDTGRKVIIIGDEDICGEAHFCTGGGDPFPVAIRTEDGLRMVDVPDEVLQTAKPFSVYLYRKDDRGGMTRYLERFTVSPRIKPPGYVYTPSERLTWEQLNQRIKALEESGLGGVTDEQVADAVEAYMAEHPIDPGVDEQEIRDIVDEYLAENLTPDAPDPGQNVAQGPWAGKTHIALGTSITAGCVNYDGGYLSEMKDRCGFASYFNAGVSGAAMVDTAQNGPGICSKIRSTDFSGYDFVSIECCTNDFRLDVPIGIVGTTENKFFDTTTFCGALRSAIEYILAQKPTIHIMLIADPQRDNAGHDTNYTNSAGHKLIDYVRALHKIANFFSLSLCDWYHLSGINALTLDTYTTDGLHPNALGYARLGISAAAVANNGSCFISIDGGNANALGGVETTYGYGFINKTTGTVTGGQDVNSNWKTSDFITVTPGERFIYTGTVRPIAAASTGASVYGYNADKGPVKAIVDNGHYIEGQEFTIPDGVAYIRCCFYASGEYPMTLARVVE